jgi:hypothetical protein
MQSVLQCRYDERRGKLQAHVVVRMVSFLVSKPATSFVDYEEGVLRCPIGCAQSSSVGRVTMDGDVRRHEASWSCSMLRGRV